MKEIVLTEEEWKEIRLVLSSKLHISAMFFTVSCMVTAAIYAISCVAPRASDAVVQSLLQAYLFMGVVTIAYLVNTIYSYVVSKMFDGKHFKFKLYRKPTLCVNRSKKELKGKKYAVCKILLTRIVVRIMEKEESDECSTTE